MSGYDEGMKKRRAAKKTAWKSSAGILAGKVEITGDIVDTSELWDALRLVDAIRRRVEPLGGVELPVIARDPAPEPLKLDE
jgi:hypothetical protein